MDFITYDMTSEGMTSTGLTNHINTFKFVKITSIDTCSCETFPPQFYVKGDCEDGKSEGSNMSCLDIYDLCKKLDHEIPKHIEESYLECKNHPMFK